MTKLDIFVRKYYPILDYFLDKGLSRDAYEKEKAIKELAETYKNIIPKRVYDALYAYKFDIRNDRNYVA